MGIKLIRRTDWQSRLGDYLAGSDGRFKWGNCDCCLAVCDAVMAMTGVDPAEWFRGRYQTEKGAYKMLGEFLTMNKVDVPAGFSNRVRAMTAVITKSISAIETPVLHAGRGDIALLPCGENRASGLGIVVGDRVLTPGLSGWVANSLPVCETVWKIG